MGTTKTNICNMALSKIGARRITDITDVTREAQLCSDMYGLAKDATLQSSYWKFATKRVELGLLVDAPLFGFANAYQLPLDYIKIVRLENSSDLYSVEGRTLLCDATPLRIKYISNDVPEADFPPEFTQALAAFLAHEISYSLTENGTLKDRLFGEYKDKAADAKTEDSREASPREFMNNPWLNARRGFPSQYTNSQNRGN